VGEVSGADFACLVMTTWVPGEGLALGQAEKGEHHDW
jgi:hypothetical protein